MCISFTIKCRSISIIRFSLINIIIYLGLIFFLGCTKESAKHNLHDRVSVQISATIESLYPYASKISDNGFDKAIGLNAGDSDIGSDIERVIKCIRILVFESDILVKNILYMSPDIDISGEEKHFLISTSGEIQMYLDLLAGNYDFILVANENPIWGLEETKNKKGLLDRTIDNNILSSLDLNHNITLNKRGIPMVGLQSFAVPFDPTYTSDNPYALWPTIDLKRTISKIEIYMTNESQSGLIFPESIEYQIVSAELRRANIQYSLIENVNSTVAENFEDNFIVPIAHIKGTSFPSQKILERYIAERLNSFTESTATTIYIKVNAGGKFVENSLPIFQYNLYGNRDYRVFRNTIYRINCKLQGNALLFALYVLPWNVIYSGKIFDETGVPFGQNEKLKLSSDMPYDELNNCVVLKYSSTNPLNGLTLSLGENTSGALWKATLTDGLDFIYTSETGYIEGGVTATSSDQKVKIIPRHSPKSGIMGTEIYFSINGKEWPIEVEFPDGETKTFSSGMERLSLKVIME